MCEKQPWEKNHRLIKFLIHRNLWWPRSIFHPPFDLESYTHPVRRDPSSFIIHPLIFARPIHIQQKRSHIHQSISFHFNYLSYIIQPSIVHHSIIIIFIHLMFDKISNNWNQLLSLQVHMQQMMYLHQICQWIFYQFIN